MAIHFAQNGYDRCSLQRQRQLLLKKSVENGSALFLFIFDGKVGIRKTHGGFEAAFIETSTVLTAYRNKLTGSFLGEVGGMPVFGIRCDEHPDGILSSDCGDLFFMELKQVTPYLSKMHASIIGYAVAMIHWHRNHQFCGVCGNPTESSESGHVLQCTNRDCDKKTFPRTDPAVIALVHNGESCLLGRQRGWPDRLYSTIAGFVEPGESPEQAVYREVYEETGTLVRNVQYFASQPWPFPASLMLGFTACWDTGLISMKDNELQDARWYSRDELAEWIPNGKIQMPNRISIAWKLIEHWFNESSTVKFHEVCGE